MQQIELMSMSIIQHRMNTLRIGVEMLGFGGDGSGSKGSAPGKPSKSLTPEEQEKQQQLALGQLGALQALVGASGMGAPPPTVSKNGPNVVANSAEVRMFEELRQMREGPTEKPE